MSQMQQSVAKASDGNSIKGKLLNAIKILKDSEEKMQGGQECVILLGNTGCGKSTIFNWLMGKQIQAVQNQEKKTEWRIEVEDSISSVSGGKSSQTTFPIFGQLNNGIVFIDLPGTEDTRGWDQELINQWIFSKISLKFQRIKIILVCDYNQFQCDRGKSSRDFIQTVSSLTQNSPKIHESVFLVITKLKLEEDEAEYIKDIRKDCNDMISSQPNQNGLQCIIKNDIFIMKKAEKNAVYLDQERSRLYDMIDKLKSTPLILQILLNSEINENFTQYFSECSQQMKTIFNNLIVEIQEMFKAANNLENITQITRLLSEFKNQILQHELHQINQYQSFLQLYFQVFKLCKGQKHLNAFNYINYDFVQIYDYFFSWKHVLLAYSSIVFIDCIGIQKLFQNELILQENSQKLLYNQKIEAEERQNKLIQQQVENQLKQEEFENKLRQQGIDNQLKQEQIENQSREAELKYKLKQQELENKLKLEQIQNQSILDEISKQKQLQEQQKKENYDAVEKLQKSRNELKIKQHQQWIEMNKAKIALENDNRRWNPFKRPLIPKWVTDYDAYIKEENEKYAKKK